MTRLPLSANGKRRIAGVHVDADGVHVVILEQGDAPRVVESVTTTDERLAETLKDLRADHVVRVVPASSTVCRVVQAPLTGAPDDLDAVALLAETQLPESVPMHRRAGGALDDAHVLLTAWPERGAVDADPAHAFVAEPAALAMLGGGLSWRADRSAGSICIVARSDAVHVRAAIGDASTDESWTSAVRAALDESADAANLPAPDGDLDGLHLGESINVSGAASDSVWRSRYALALGAALCAAAAPATASLAGLRAGEPRDREPLHRRAATWVSRPTHAWATIAACIVLAVLSPLAFASARLFILERKAEMLNQRESDLQELRNRAALYRQLETSRWPMTKLLADISGAAPVGVTTDVVRLNTRQGLRIEGSAESDELIVAFQQQLLDARIFRNVRIDSTNAAGAEVGFALSADVVRPLGDVKPVEDFGEITLAERLYGEGASNTAFDASGRSSTRTTRRPSGRESLDRERGDAPERAGARPVAEDKPLPPPLTDEQISAMSRMEAMREFVTRRNFTQTQTGLDAATKDRLQDEIRRLQAHSRAGGGS